MNTLRESRTPNLFRYGRKELSQDAMICRLLKWSNQRLRSEDGELHDCGVRFVTKLLEKHGAQLRDTIDKVEVLQQASGIDVLARINSKQVFLIEDKTGTKDHSNQLKRYYDLVTGAGTDLGEVVEERVFPIYLKTGNQAIADDRRIEKEENYKLFDRADFLSVLKDYGGSDSILGDFKDYLRGLEDATQSYTMWKADGERECRLAWEGFYRRLEYELDDGSRRSMGWGDVSNPSGGFLGFW